MIELYYWPTPNGHKITIFLEEAELEYQIVPVDISAGEQFKPEFLKISPNNRMPAIIDDRPTDGGEAISVFESGAILQYLAEKTGKFLPNSLRERKAVSEWLFWQVGGLGPMAGQNHHFGQYAPEKIPYAIDRYVRETNRLYGVLNKQLEGKEYIVGEYSIADMACYPWIVPYEKQQQNLDEFPNLKRWFESVRSRPAVIRAYEKGQPWMSQPTITEESKKILFGQTSKNLS
ncbi:thiol:disulfide oxidoreductase [[Phormidium ambiguum] IAM M-71]|uniref:Thiol:disulfide oxidoreductase n=1 Tax=[Phormidium ambiguum] IAM M-71 TaxID=454136 RepID=A0A1U7IRJ1_9CYAN|nr:glutathione S-transferase N-terminal domain-containing protein [Phormidium ambiguum]OKH40057.1 thiol:disulfide oxidoreductase [Phormidium ambiguum IAM M-71]